MTLAHKLVGNAMQQAVVQLAPDQPAYCEAGRFFWKRVTVPVATRLAKPPAHRQRPLRAPRGLLPPAKLPAR